MYIGCEDLCGGGTWKRGVNGLELIQSLGPGSNQVPSSLGVLKALNLCTLKERVFIEDCNALQVDLNTSVVLMK